MLNMLRVAILKLLLFFFVIFHFNRYISVENNNNLLVIHSILGRYYEYYVLNTYLFVYSYILCNISSNKLNKK